MKKKLIPVGTFYAIAICDKCEGEMKATGLTLSSNPPQHEYICMNPECRHKDFHTTRFPTVEYQTGIASEKLPEDKNGDA